MTCWQTNVMLKAYCLADRDRRLQKTSLNKNSKMMTLMTMQKHLDWYHVIRQAVSVWQADGQNIL